MCYIYIFIVVANSNIYSFLAFASADDYNDVGKCSLSKSQSVFHILRKVKNDETVSLSGSLLFDESSTYHGMFVSPSVNDIIFSSRDLKIIEEATLSLKEHAIHSTSDTAHVVDNQNSDNRDVGAAVAAEDVDSKALRGSFEFENGKMENEKIKLNIECPLIEIVSILNMKAEPLKDRRAQIQYLNSEIQKIQQDRGRYKCKKCNKIFRNETYIDHHLLYRHQELEIVNDPNSSQKSLRCIDDYCLFLPCQDNEQETFTYDKCLKSVYECFSFSDRGNDKNRMSMLHLKNTREVFFNWVERICKPRQKINVNNAIKLKKTSTEGLLKEFFWIILRGSWYITQLIITCFVLRWYYNQVKIIQNDEKKHHRKD